MAKSKYNYKQWQWVNDRIFKDEYPVKEVAEFLGVNIGAVYSHLAKKKHWSRGDTSLPSLNTRNAEFLALGKGD